MAYLVVIDYNNDTKKCSVVGVSDEPELSLIQNFGVVDYDVLGNLAIQTGFKPLNFDVDRNGNVKQFCGFDRFKSKLHAVVLGEISSTSGTILGYRLISSNGEIVNKRKKEILAIASKSDEPFLQNGIIAKGVIKCYKLHKFPSIVTGGNTKVVKPKKAKQTVPPKEKNPVKNSFTEEQKKEFRKAQNHGVDTRFMENPDLNEKQLRVLWVSKSKGALSEYFAKPEYSVDVMKWYADRLYTKKAVNERAQMLANPDLSVEQLNELEDCVLDGVDYSDICDPKLSLGHIQVERIKRCKKLWSDISTSNATEDDIMNNAINFINKHLI